MPALTVDGNASVARLTEVYDQTGDSMTRALQINSDGTCIRRDIPADKVAQAEVSDSLDVLSVRHPLFERGRYVLYVDDWGAVKELAINIKAWALYGGSPVYGAAVLGEDDQLPIDDRLIELIEGEFPDPIILSQMRAFLTRSE